jgi:hypothetical protein
MQKNSNSSESDHRKIKSLSSRDTAGYINDRLGYKINVYDKLGDSYKWIFWLTTSISLICAALVPVLINQDGYKVWATGLSLVVTIMVGLQGIFHPREHWRNYDMISATLRREEMLFSTQSGEYENLDEKQRFHLLVRRVEEFIAREREETIIMRTSEKETSATTKTSTDGKNE